MAYLAIIVVAGWAVVGAVICLSVCVAAGRFNREAEQAQPPQGGNWIWPPSGRNGSQRVVQHTLEGPWMGGSALLTNGDTHVTPT
jgi:hypothetical protein